MLGHMSGAFELTLGLDLRPQTTGAVQYALWLCKTAGLVPSGHVQPVHVIEPDAMSELLRHADEATVTGAFQQRGKAILDEVAHGEQLHKPEVLYGDPVQLLESRARERESTALLISRRAPSDIAVTYPRLGSVARRLLRRLAVPIIVTPSDLLSSQVGEGPIVIAVDFEEGSARAVEWAKPFAASIHRELRLVHVAEMPDQLGYAGFVQAERWDQLANEILDRGRERMDEFQRSKGFTGISNTVIRGPVLPGLVDYAAAAKACMLVTGSGHHGLMHRILVPSVASESASVSAIPVAVVP